MRSNGILDNFLFYLGLSGVIAFYIGAILALMYSIIMAFSNLWYVIPIVLLVILLCAVSAIISSS
jgi:hypothetical protein